MGDIEQLKKQVDKLSPEELITMMEYIHVRQGKMLSRMSEDEDVKIFYNCLSSALEERVCYAQPYLSVVCRGDGAQLLRKRVKEIKLLSDRIFSGSIVQAQKIALARLVCDIWLDKMEKNGIQYNIRNALTLNSTIMDMFEESFPGYLVSGLAGKLPILRGVSTSME